MVVPANLIIGSLGVGKTTTINHLLRNKPATERWGVIVNEFGEIGVDGALIAQNSDAVIEVPGGCICCSASLPSREALGQLITAQKLDRILIEPTGLAHPRNVLVLFSSAPYRALIELQATVCIVDPWYFEHADFEKINGYELQLKMADVLVANRCDKATKPAISRFEAFAKKTKLKAYDCIQHGQLDPDLLLYPCKDIEEIGTVRSNHLSDTKTRTYQSRMWQRIESKHAQGATCGWLFDPEVKFRSSIKKWVETSSIYRIKGILETELGWAFVNKSGDDVEWISVPQTQSASWQRARLEMLSSQAENWQSLERDMSEFILPDVSIETRAKHCSTVA